MGDIISIELIRGKASFFVNYKPYASGIQVSVDFPSASIMKRDNSVCHFGLLSSSFACLHVLVFWSMCVRVYVNACSLFGECASLAGVCIVINMKISSQVYVCMLVCAGVQVERWPVQMCAQFVMQGDQITILRHEYMPPTDLDLWLQARQISFDAKDSGA